MHGMINRALQGFLVATYGEEMWADVRIAADLRFEDFESMLHYEDGLTVECFTAATELLHQHPNSVLEDLGTFLITHPPLDPLRRLLRFGGPNFTEFILSLDELKDRGRMAIPDMELPDISVTSEGEGCYLLRARWTLPGIGPILLGALRAMADDYGSLAVLNLVAPEDGAECVSINVLDSNHAVGRSFVLAEAGP